MLLREEEADAEIGEAALRGRRGDVEIEAKRFERVGGAGLGRGGAIAMLGDRHIAGRDHKTDGVETLSV